MRHICLVTSRLGNPTEESIINDLVDALLKDNCMVTQTNKYPQERLYTDIWQIE